MSEKQNKLVAKQLATDGARLKIARIKADITIQELNKKMKAKMRNTAIQHMECGNLSDLFKHEKVFKIIGENVPIKLTIPYLEEVLGVLNERLNNVSDTFKGGNAGGYTSKLKKEIIWVKELINELNKDGE